MRLDEFSQAPVADQKCEQLPVRPCLGHMNKPKIKVSVVSDVVCPWCYIGKRRLERAIEKVSDKYDFEIEYLPFELNPQIPTEGLDQKAYLTQKFGGPGRYNEITSHVTGVAAQEGISFDFNAQKISPNTRKAHRIVQLAKEEGKQAQAVESFYRAYFTDGVDLSKDENLVSIASEAGLDAAKIALFLQSDTGSTEVQMAEQQLQQLGISGVPFYIIDNKYGVSGAQPTDTFIKAFEEISSAPVADGEGCDVNGKNC